jgi:polyketide biosynthesis acyl carrier protein
MPAGRVATGRQAVFRAASGAGKGRRSRRALKQATIRRNAGRRSRPGRRTAALAGNRSHSQFQGVLQIMSIDKQEILDTLYRHAREVLPALADHPFKQGDSLKALGANSVDRADIIMMTLESLSLEISMVDLARAENIDALADIIHAKS